jgi:hypothetical protein
MDLVLNSLLAVSERGLHYIWLIVDVTKGSIEVPLFHWKFEALVIVMWRYKAF